MTLCDPVRVYAMRNGRVLTDAADAVRLPDHIMQGFADLAAMGRRIAAEVATARAERRQAFRAALGLLKRRQREITNGLPPLDLDQITTEVAAGLHSTPAAATWFRPPDRSRPLTLDLDALVMAAHAPPAFHVSTTSPQREPMT